MLPIETILALALAALLALLINSYTGLSAMLAA
jgi:hypothetical protein